MSTTDARSPSAPRLVRRLFGKLFGDCGYISQALAEQLFATQGLLLITKMRKRALIESVNDQRKSICQIEHTRHRSPYNFLVHLLAGLIACCHQPKNPSLHLARDLDLLAVG